MLREFAASVPLRVKLVAGCQFVTAVSLAVALYFSHRSSRYELDTQVANNLNSQAAAHALAIGDLLAAQLDTLEALAVSHSLREAVAAANASYPDDEAGNPDRAEALDSTWMDDRAGDELRDARLNNPLAEELRAFRAAFPLSLIHI